MACWLWGKLTSGNECWKSKCDLEAGLETFTVPPHSFNFHHDGHLVRHLGGPAQKRRRQRRETAQRVAAAAQDSPNNDDAVEVSEEAVVICEDTAEMERTNEVESATKAPIEESGNEAEEACKVDENPFKCEKCESIFKNIRGLKTHQGRAHKIIPQVDGPGEELEWLHLYICQ